MYTYISSLLNLPPTSHPIPPLWVIAEHQVELLVLYSNFLLSVLQMVMCVFQCYTLNSSHPLFPLLCPQPVLLSEVKVAQLCPTLCDPMDYTVHGILQARVLEAFPSPGDLPNPGIKPRSPALQAGSLPAEPQGKPKNTGVGSLSLLQQIFPTQKSNQGLLHCRQILYQSSYEVSPWQP